MTARLAALDLGSNSFHLAIFSLLGPRRFELAAKHKEKVQLGRSVFDGGAIAPSAFEHDLQALSRLSAALEGQRIDTLLAVATSALREAENGREFVARAERVLGHPIRIIDGQEEARLVGLGAQVEAAATSRTAIVDLGGGSLEIAFMHERRSAFAASLQVGTLRSRRSWTADTRPSAVQLLALRAEVEARLSPALARVQQLGCERLLLSCGAARDLWALVQGAAFAPGGPVAAKASGAALTRCELDCLHIQLLERAARKAPVATRSARDIESLIVACNVFQLLLDRLSLPHAEVAYGSLRHGLVVDYLETRDTHTRETSARHADAHRSARSAFAV